MFYSRFIVLTFIVFFFSCNTIAQIANSWRTISSAIEDDFLSINFSDSLNGWVLGTKVILHSTDGGETWIKQRSIDSASYRKVFFLNHKIGFAYQGKGLMQTSDGGINWNVQNEELQNCYIGGMSFINDNTGWLISNSLYGDSFNEIVMKTNNAGQSWDTLFSRINMVKFYDIQFLDSLTGYIIGSDGHDNFAPIYVYKSSNGGKSWNDISWFGGAHTFYLSSKNEDTLWAGGFGFAKSYDGGITWNPYFIIESEDSVFYGQPRFYDILQFDSKCGYAIIVTTKGPNQAKFRLYYTQDSGSNWDQIEIPPDVHPTAVCSLGKYLFIAGLDGKLVTNKPTSVRIKDNLAEYSFILYQNFPNPFNPTTKIKYSIPVEVYCNAPLRNVLLKVYDVLGREVSTLVNEEKPAGTYEIDFNGNNLPSGIYFYQLNAGEFVETKKMILLK